MPEPSPAAAPSAAHAQDPIVNRLSIQVATVNGSGSQTANNTLLRSIFQMGVPVSGKNLFPSNIAGLPTWFTIRANADGYIARRKEIDVLICMNPTTVEQDVRGVPAGATIVCDDTILKSHPRTDVTFIAVPFQNIVRECCPKVDLRKLVVNMVYVGVLAEMLGIEIAEVEKALGKAFKTKPKALELNQAAVAAGVAYAKASIGHRPRFQVRRMDRTAGKVLVDGNTACAVGALFGGATVLAWYPITPSSSLAEAFQDLAEKHRRDPATGEGTFAIVQAEDELASIGMVVGAGWAGARAFTTTSGPGISLMSEFVGLAYYAEVPGVIMDVQRTGPSTGLPTRTMQGDVLKAALLSHGDCKHPCLYPSDITEAYEMAAQSFDLAERLQTIVFLMTDLDLGMNLWMAEPWTMPTGGLDRGKVLDEKGLKEMKDWGRYKDVDGDGIPHRSLPGTPGGLGAYFTRGSGHDEYARYTEDGAAYARNMDRLQKKLETARGLVPGPVADGKGSKVGILAFGTTHHAIVESRDQLRGEHDLVTDYLRLRAFPFSDAVRAWLESHERVYVVEQNRDAQMLQLLRMEWPALATRCVSVLHYDGLPIDARSVTDQIAAHESKRSKGGAR